MVANALLILLGMVIVFLWRFIWDRGHAVFGVQDARVQNILTQIIQRYAGLRPLHMIEAHPTHQQVFSGGTVIAWFDPVPEIAGLPSNARSYVVWGKERRNMAVQELVYRLRALGHEASVHEPLAGFPPGTFLMVVSSAFLGSAHAFRPHWIKMAYLQMKAKK